MMMTSSIVAAAASTIHVYALISLKANLSKGARLTGSPAAVCPGFLIVRSITLALTANGAPAKGILTITGIEPVAVLSCQQLNNTDHNSSLRLSSFHPFILSQLMF